MILLGSIAINLCMRIELTEHENIQLKYNKRSLGHMGSYKFRTLLLNHLNRKDKWEASKFLNVISTDITTKIREFEANLEPTNYSWKDLRFG